jgi:hypothetical protein
MIWKNVKTSYKVIVGIILLLIIFRLALPSIVKSYVNKKLNQLPGYTGHVDDIDIHLIRGAYAIEGLELRKKIDPPKYPFLQIQHIDLSVEWKYLFKGSLVGEVEMDRPVINILASTADLSKEPSRASWTETVEALMPMTINRLVVRNGRFAYLDFSRKPDVNLYIDGMNLTALNLANVEAKGTPLPSSVALTGTSIGNGHLKANMKLNALKQIPDFNLNMQLTGTKLTSLNGFIKAYGKFDVERGGLDLYSELELNNGQLKGYAKPFFKNIKVLNWKKDKKEGGILSAAKEAVIGLFVKVVENPKTKKVATKIPIKGNVNNPETSGWATFLGILKNAFIKAFQQGIEGSLN